MQLYENVVKQQILSIYDSFTAAECQIAEFFLKDQEENDLSAKAVSQKLYVSMASLTRFAKKCGYAGYREFLYEYSVRNHASINADQLLRSVLNHYQQIVSKGYQVLDEEKLQEVAKLMVAKRRIFVYGIGSSGVATQEMKYRFMRLGLDIEAITDAELMKMNTVNLHEDCLLIGISLSGNQVIHDNFDKAKSRGATCVLISAKTNLATEVDNELLVPSIGNIEIGNVISPILPVLLVIDLLYAYCLLESPKLNDMLLQTLSESYKKNLD